MTDRDLLSQIKDELASRKGEGHATAYLPTSDVDRLVALAEQAEAYKAALREIADFGKDDGVGRKPPTIVARFALREAQESEGLGERCPVCEGVDDPGVTHNRRAQYCSAQDSEGREG